MVGKTMLLVVFLLLVGLFPAAAETARCDDRPDLVGRCFTVRGRLGVYNGIPIRIWVVGTHRMLMVDDTGGVRLPTAVETLLARGAPQEFVVFGDYRVCPLSPDHPGWMRRICVAGVSHPVAAKWRDAAGGQP